MSRRASLHVSVAMPTPLIYRGRPVVPAHWAVFGSVATAVQGSAHVHAGDPKPIWNPSTGGWATPPPTDAPVWHGRWVVDDLPDPPSGGYYWLGSASAADGTAGYTGGRTAWAPHVSAAGAPSWHSFFPFKPSVRSFDSYLPDGGIVHHPKGVHFNSQYVEHMWADFGGSRRQPFTWVIAGMIAGFPSAHYTHFILDAGRNPDAVGFPRLSGDEVYTGRTIRDGLDYRTLMSYSVDGQKMCTRPNSYGPHTLRARTHAAVRPKMFFGVFNGAHSMTGAYGPASRRIDSGYVDNSRAQSHRFYVLGRSQGHIAQGWASHLLLFEIRYWRAALTKAQLDSQYAQLSSSYQFDRYRGVG